MGMILTQAGQNAINALLASNGTLTIAEMSFGSDDRHPTGGEVALTTELIRKPVLNKTVDGTKTRFDARLEHDEGPFVIHEIGLHDENGTLIFIGRVEGLTKLVTAGEAHSIDVSANVFTSNFQNVVVEVDSNFAFVPATRKIDAGTGLTGGGDFSADREMAVDFATEAEALAGEEAAKSISPKALAAPLALKMDAADGVGTGTTALEKLIAGGEIEASTHAKAQINGFLRTGALLMYAHQGDDALNPLIAGSVKALMNRATDNRPTWGGSPVWTDDAGGRSLPGMSGATWWRAPDGLIIQAAWPSAADGQTVTFPITFPNACNAVMLTENHPTAVLSICAQNVTPNGFTFRAHNTVTNATHSGASQHMMLAIGH